MNGCSSYFKMVFLVFLLFCAQLQAQNRVQFRMFAQTLHVDSTSGEYQQVPIYIGHLLASGLEQQQSPSEVRGAPDLVILRNGKYRVYAAEKLKKVWTEPPQGRDLGLTHAVFEYSYAGEIRANVFYESPIEEGMPPSERIEVETQNIGQTFHEMALRYLNIKFQGKKGFSVSSYLRHTNWVRDSSDYAKWYIPLYLKLPQLGAKTCAGPLGVEN